MFVRIREDLDDFNIPVWGEKERYLGREEVDGAECISNNGDNDNDEEVMVKLSSGECVVLYSIDLEFHD